jgi:hypothetical protein
VARCRGMIGRFGWGRSGWGGEVNHYRMLMGRWVSPTLRALRQGRRGIAGAVVGCVITVLLIAGWGFCSYWRMGKVVLTAVGEAVVVQVLEEESDRPVGGPVGLVDRAVIALPAGGGTGRRIRSAGAAPESSRARGYADLDWTEACVVEPKGAPDVIVEYSDRAECSLARLRSWGLQR